MPEEKTRRVLLCGGHADGQWMTVPTFQHGITVPRPAKVQLPTSEDDLSATTDVEDYRLDQLNFFGLRLWIAVPTTLFGNDRDRAVLRAILQRDAAQQLLGSR